MPEIIKSKGWDWNIIQEEHADVWKNPAIESFYLVNRWKNRNKKDFLDLGCGLGRHTILFAKNGFNTFAFDISDNAVAHAKQWTKEEQLSVDFMVGDMLDLPYDNESFDCILCRNVIAHTDTNGMRRVVSELRRVLRPGGECYLTLGSKNAWGFQQDWPMVDENTKLRMEEGPEWKVPHFYADYDLVQELFKSFKIESIEHIGTFHIKDDGLGESYHYHVLIRKEA